MADWKNGKWSKLVGIIGRTKNQKKLAKIVQKARYDIAKVALEDITDQALLEKLVLNKKTKNREYFVEKVENQELLAKLAAEDEDKWMRDEAAEHITDQKILFDLLMSKGHDVSYDAFGHLTDTTLLKEFALHGPDSYSRRYAMKKIGDKDFIESLALDEKLDIGVRIDAVTLIDDPDVLFKVYPIFSVLCQKIDYPYPYYKDTITNSMLLIEIAAGLEPEKSGFKKCIEELHRTNSDNDRGLIPKRLVEIAEDEKTDIELGTVIYRKLKGIGRESMLSPETLKKLGKAKEHEDYCKKIEEEILSDRRRFDELLEKPEMSFTYLAGIFDKFVAMYGSKRLRWKEGLPSYYESVGDALRYLAENGGMSEKIKERFPKGTYTCESYWEEHGQYDNDHFWEEYEKKTITLF